MLQVDRQRSRGRRAWPRRNAHLRHRHRKKRREQQSRRRWQGGAPVRGSLLTTRAMQNPSETELDTLSQRACALNQPWLVPGILLPFHLHCCLALLPCMPRETVADLL